MQEREIICPHCRKIANWQQKCPVVLIAEVAKVIRKSPQWLRDPLRKFPKPIGNMIGTKGGIKLYLRAEVLKWATWHEGPQLAALLDQVLV